MSLLDALEIAMATNPEIAEAAANRRAIGFEYEQARYLNRPSLILEGRFGPELVDSRTTRILGNDDQVLFGRQASATLQQNLFSFGRNDAEKDRQASRIDAAAIRVEERSEFVALDVIQAYLDVSRIREIIAYSDENVVFNQNKVEQLTRGARAGVTSSADARQAEERLSAAQVVRSETEESLDVAEASFIRLVGMPVGQTTLPASISAAVPQSLADALAEARRNNPTLRIAHADLDTSRAEYRKSKSDLKPEVLFELVGRAGEDIGGFEDTSNDVRAQIRFRHEFRGGIKSAAVQEHLNRIDESRARIMSLERNVEQIVREAWSTRNRTRLRVNDLERQVAQGTDLLNSYQREFEVNRRTLLDILDAESSLFQAKSALATAKYSDIFAQYRLLAATGQLLDTLSLEPLREANTGLRDLENVPSTPPAETEKRRNPAHAEKVAKNNFSMASTHSKPMDPTDFASISITPIVRQSSSPEEARAALQALDNYANADVPALPKPATVNLGDLEQPVKAILSDLTQPNYLKKADLELNADAFGTEMIANSADVVTLVSEPAMLYEFVEGPPIEDVRYVEEVQLVAYEEVTVVKDDAVALTSEFQGLEVKTVSAQDFKLMLENPDAKLMSGGDCLDLNGVLFLSR